MASRPFLAAWPVTSAPARSRDLALMYLLTPHPSSLDSTPDLLCPPPSASHTCFQAALFRRAPVSISRAISALITQAGSSVPQLIYLWIVARFALFTMMPHLALCFASSSIANALVQAPVICFLKDCEKPGYPRHDSGCLAHDRSTTPRSQDWAGSKLGCEVRWHPGQACTHNPVSV